jgi:hypothetical protein
VKARRHPLRARAPSLPATAAASACVHMPAVNSICMHTPPAVNSICMHTPAMKSAFVRARRP